MKKALFPILSITLIFSLVLTTGCDDIIDDDDPLADPREKFTGVWQTTETSTLYPQPTTFSIKVELDVNTAQIRLYNIYQLGQNTYAYAIVTGNSFTIPEQDVESMVIEGFAQMKNNNLIEIEYTVNDGADLDNVIGEMNRSLPALPSPQLALEGAELFHNRSI